MIEIEEKSLDDKRTDMEEIECAIKDVAKAIGATKAILFGSFARGTGTRKSDVDVVFIQETSLRFLERLSVPMDLLFRKIRGKDIDVLVYTPGEFDRMRSGGNRFILRILHEGRVLYGT
jgi:predicted nucleotidyltransferase